MKSHVGLALLWLVLPVTAIGGDDHEKELGFTDLRIINGRLYEFGKLKGVSGMFTVAGKVESSSGSETVLLDEYEVFIFQPQETVGEALQGFHAGSALDKAAAARLCNGRRTLGQFFTLSNTVRQHIRMESRTDRFTVKNSANYKVRAFVKVAAVKVSEGVYDAGVRFAGDIHVFNSLLRLTDGGAVAVGIPSRGEIEARMRRKKEVLLGFQVRQAEAGSASFQYELGRRYLNGDGVERDAAKAQEWFGKAAAQDHAQAKALLETLKREGKQPEGKR